MNAGLEAWALFLRRLLAYLVPGVLIIIEEALRSVGHLDAQTFVGPTLASVGVGLLMPLMQPHPGKPDRSIPDAFYHEAEAHHIPIQTPLARFFEAICLVALFVAIAVWTWTLYLSVTAPHGGLGPFPAYDDLGAVNYLLGVVLTEAREHI